MNKYVLGLSIASLVSGNVSKANLWPFSSTSSATESAALEAERLKDRVAEILHVEFPRAFTVRPHSETIVISRKGKNSYFNKRTLSDLSPDTQYDVVTAEAIDHMRRHSLDYQQRVEKRETRSRRAKLLSTLATLTGFGTTFLGCALSDRRSISPFTLAMAGIGGFATSVVAGAVIYCATRPEPSYDRQELDLLLLKHWEGRRIRGGGIEYADKKDKVLTYFGTKGGPSARQLGRNFLKATSEDKPFTAFDNEMYQTWAKPLAQTKTGDWSTPHWCPRP